MVGRCTLKSGNTAYRNLANAARGLAFAIEHGHAQRVTCPLCHRYLALTSDCTFRSHAGGTSLCQASGKTPEEAAALSANKK